MLCKGSIFPNLPQTMSNFPHHLNPHLSHSTTLPSPLLAQTGNSNFLPSLRQVSQSSSRWLLSPPLQDGSAEAEEAAGPGSFSLGRPGPAVRAARRDAEPPEERRGTPADRLRPEQQRQPGPWRRRRRQVRVPVPAQQPRAGRRPHLRPAPRVREPSAPPRLVPPGRGGLLAGAPAPAARGGPHGPEPVLPGHRPAVPAGHRPVAV